MNKHTLHALIAINAALLLIVAALIVIPPGTLQPKPAHAQFGGGGDYTMIAAKRGGNNAHAVHVIDVTNGILLTVEPSRRSQAEIEVVAFRNIAPDFQARTGR